MYFYYFNSKKTFLTFRTVLKKRYLSKQNVITSNTSFESHFFNLFFSKMFTQREILIQKMSKKLREKYSNFKFFRLFSSLSYKLNLLKKHSFSD